jgi:hypothetical protein
MTKFQKTFQDMLNQNQELFDKFSQTHQNFTLNPKEFQKEFDEIGREVQDVVRRYENRLCSSSESSGFGKYSTNLADKFQKEVKEAFPKIDFVGAED